MSELFVELDQLSICYETFGDENDQPLLLIMGLGTQMIHWDERFCQQLASQGYWVIRFDNRDIGKSTKLSQLKAPSMPYVLANQLFGAKLKAPYDLNDMARDAFALLDHLNIDSCHVVGVSMGGMIAQCMAINAPHRVLSLTSIMSTTGDTSLPRAKKSFMLKVMQPPPKELDEYVQYATKLWRLLHADHFTFDQERIEKLMVRARERSFCPAGVWRQTCAILASPDRTKSLNTLRVPSLVLHGDLDPLVPLECGLATAKAIPDAKLKVFEGMGHTLPEQLWPSMIDEIRTLR